MTLCVSFVEPCGFLLIDVECCFGMLQMIDRVSGANVVGISFPMVMPLHACVVFLCNCVVFGVQCTEFEPCVICCNFFVALLAYLML